MSVIECTLQRDKVIFNHARWAPLEGKWLRMSQDLEVQVQSRGDGKENLLSSATKRQLSFQWWHLQLIKSSLLCPGCWKQAAFYRGRSDIGISSEDPLTAQALSSWKSEGSCAGLVSAGCSGHTLLRCSGRHAVCFCDSLLAVPLISCINWMQIISPNISWTRPRSVWAKPSYSRYPESQSCVSTVLCLVSRDEEQRMLAFRDLRAAMALLPPVAKEGNAVLV